MMILNDSIVALIYYNLLEKERYDIKSVKDRQRAGNNLKNSKNIDTAILEEAYRQYKSILDSEFETLTDKLNEKKNKKIQ